LVVSELLMGVELADTFELKVARGAFVEAIISRFPVLDFNTDVARVHSKIFAHIKKIKTKSDKNTNAHDLIIGATALAYGHSVLTNNISDFACIPGLKVIPL